MNKYNLMWGGKLSVMLTEAMISQLCSTIDENGNEIPTNIDETLFIIKDGVFEHYMPETSIKRLEYLGKRFLDKRYSEIVNKKIESHINNFFIFCKKYETTDFKKLDNIALKKILAEYQEFVRMGLVYFAVSSPFTTNAIESKIKLILEKKHVKDAEDQFILLTTPKDMDETMLERIAFFQLMAKKDIKQKDLIDYTRKYPALFLNTYNKKEIILFMKDKLKETKNIDEINHEINKIKNNLKNIEKRQNALFAKIKFNELERLAFLIQKIALDRYRLKQVWSGAEYMFLDMFEFLAKKAGINLKEFVKVYSFTDINKILLENKKLNKKTETDHKEMLIFHYFDNKINVFSGPKAHEHIKKLKIEKKDEIKDNQLVKGVIANKGKATGKVRIVNVRDLKQFIKDCKNFKKGEILVTTMTSPIMVPIIEKAGAIVTVEGGICSHAAVISREFGIPCIVGTGNATKILKDGDMVEVDADKGVVSLIN